MNSAFEKFMTYLIAGIFALALIADTILELNGINVPGLFSLSLGLCSGLFMAVLLRKKDKSVLEIVLVIAATLVSITSGIYQIIVA